MDQASAYTSSTLLAAAAEVLQNHGYQPARPENLKDWTGSNARIFEDAYGIVAVVVHETWQDLLSHWIDAQAALVDLISARVGRSEPKSWEGYLVLLTPSVMEAGSESAAQAIRYDTSRVRKLVASGDEISHLVEEAAPHRDVGDIRTPDLVRLVDGQMPQQIRIDLVPRMRLARLRVLVDRRQAHLGHQPTDMVAPNAPAVASQVSRHLPRAVPGRLQELLVEEAHQPERLFALRCRFTVERRATDRHQLALRIVSVANGDSGTKKSRLFLIRTMGMIQDAVFGFLRLLNSRSSAPAISLARAPVTSARRSANPTC